MPLPRLLPRIWSLEMFPTQKLAQTKANESNWWKRILKTLTSITSPHSNRGIISHDDDDDDDDDFDDDDDDDDDDDKDDDDDNDDDTAGLILPCNDTT